MKKTIFGVIVGLALGAAVMWLAGRHYPAPVKAETAGAPAEKPKGNPLRLNAAKRAAAGVTLGRPAASSLAPEVTAFGRVIDPAPFVALVAELETARAALAASQKD